MRLFLITAITLFHAVSCDDSIVYAPSQQSWNIIVSDGDVKFDYHDKDVRAVLIPPSPITFSTQHKHCSHHTSSPQYDLNRMNTKQLAWYFSAQGYTEGEVLSHPMLYMNQAYLALVQQLPRYSEYVKMYYEKYRTYKGFFKFWETIHFRYRKGMRKQFARLHWECEQQRKTQQAKVNTIEPHSIVNANTIRFAREYGITEQQLALIHNNAQAQQLHREFLEQLNEAQTISAYYALQQKNILIDAVGYGVAIGMGANSLHQRDTATAWARFGRQVLEVIEGVSEGIVLFAENNVHMIRHPIYTLKQVVHCLGQVTGMCARSIGTVAHWHELTERGDGLLMAQEMDDIANQIIACGTLCTEKLATMPTRDIAKHAIAIAADVLLTHKMFTLCGNLCAQAAPVVRDTITAINNRIPHINDAIVHVYEAARTESPMLQTAEGVLLKASEEMGKIGGVAVEIIKDARLTLESIHAEYMTNLKAELEVLRLACDNKVKGFGTFANKWIKIDYEHILGLELIFDRKGFPKFNGFHHDLMSAIENSGTIKFANKKLYAAGFYKADLIIDGTKVTKTFFPSEWSREKVVHKIYEAYENCIKSGILPELGSDGKYVIQSCIAEGVEIKICITQKGKVLTAYPILTQGL